MKIALVIAVHTLVHFADGSSVEDVHTMTTRHYKSESACEQAATTMRMQMEQTNVQKAFHYNARIERLDISHHCVEEKTDV